MPEVTENKIRYPVKNKKKGNPIRTITITEGIKALYDVKRKVIVTYLFDKKKYDMKKAKKWIKDHSSLYDDAVSLVNQTIEELMIDEQ